MLKRVEIWKFTDVQVAHNVMHIGNLFAIFSLQHQLLLPVSAA